ncbi:MAG: DnaJ C-terminal domain-containing protein [Pseudomonadota bacterium]
MEFKDYYKLMGVDASASADEIKRAYRKLARKYHPDVSEEKDAEERFKEVGEAYEVLRDPQKREQYDQLRAGGYQGGDSFRPPPDWGDAFGSGGVGGGFSGTDYGRSAGGFSDFFETLFGRAARQQQAPRRGQDIHASVEIDLETAYAGGMRRISLQQPEVAADGSVQTAVKSLDVKIPPGMTEGKQIRLAGKGGPGPQPGDLYLQIRHAPHRWFEADGRDIHLTVPIAPWEAALGANVSVPTLGGRVNMNIKPGATSGQRLRLKHKGLPGSPVGDQYVTLKIAVPKAESEQQRELFEAMRNEFDFNPRQHLELSS